MLRALICIAFLLTLPVQSALADFAIWVDGQNLASPYMRVYGRSHAPIGHLGFCKRYPGECRSYRKKSRHLRLTKARWRQLVAINKAVNHAIEPVTDADHHGVIEHWDYPTTKGDCEDYVLFKRRLLIDNGWPENSLLITVVRDERGDGHAVLTVRTAGGDYLLDNKHDRVHRWNKVPYRFIKRQSSLHPKKWVSLYPRESEKLSSTSGRKGW